MLKALWVALSQIASWAGTEAAARVTSPHVPWSPKVAFQLWQLVPARVPPRCSFGGDPGSGRGVKPSALARDALLSSCDFRLKSVSALPGSCTSCNFCSPQRLQLIKDDGFLPLLLG